MVNDQDKSAGLKRIRLFALSFLIVFPAVYLVIGYIISMQERSFNHPGAQHDMMFYILVMLALCQPMLLPLIERAQIAHYRRGLHATMSVAQFLTTMFVIKFAVIEAVYIYSLVILFVSNDFPRMLWFWPIGAIWSVVYWPREDKMKRTLECLETL